jgi:hypothetical protein
MAEVSTMAMGLRKPAAPRFDPPVAMGHRSALNQQPCSEPGTREAQHGTLGIGDRRHAHRHVRRPRAILLDRTEARAAADGGPFSYRSFRIRRCRA